MPNTREKEKLIELLDEASGKIKELCGGLNDHNGNGVRADHLIANGVTVQKWIPVAERLPEDNSHVLAYLRIGEEGRIYPASYAKGMWWDCIFSTPTTKTTTHWMPLPEPPKGE